MVVINWINWHMKKTWTQEELQGLNDTRGELKEVLVFFLGANNTLWIAGVLFQRLDESFRGAFKQKFIPGVQIQVLQCMWWV